jgi:hypothetical protein
VAIHEIVATRIVDDDRLKVWATAQRVQNRLRAARGPAHARRSESLLSWWDAL